MPKHQAPRSRTSVCFHTTCKVICSWRVLPAALYTACKPSNSYARRTAAKERQRLQTNMVQVLACMHVAGSRLLTLATSSSAVA
jgi:hypothetical protein